MISKEEIKKLAGLARIEMKEDEVEQLRGEMDAILDYVGQVSEVAASNSSGLERSESIRNVMREDENPNEPGNFTKEILADMPDTESGFLKVKKIL